MLRAQKITFVFFSVIFILTISGIATNLKDGSLEFNSRLLFGLLFVGAVLLTSGYSWLVLSKVGFLKTKGTKVEATVTNVVENNHFLIGKRYRIICDWTDPKDNAKYTFTNYKFPLLPGYSLEKQGLVDVYVNENRKKYFVEPKRLII